MDPHLGPWLEFVWSTIHPDFLGFGSDTIIAGGGKKLGSVLQRYSTC